MTFLEWISSTTGHTWEELKSNGLQQEWLFRLFDNYEEYCSENNISPAYKCH